jgi:hydrogenase expression/formation protein HypE
MNDSSWQAACPTGRDISGERITLAHGEGGRLMRRLIRERIIARLDNEWLADAGDAAALPAVSGPIAFTTDSFVVSPIFFPGGDIGTLAVFGTVNDLVVSGAVPRWLSLSFIIEEGFSVALFDRVLDSIAVAAKEARVHVVTGDTKVVPRGTADGLFINTSGIGELIPPIPPGPVALRPGDELIVTGPVGTHGIAILACREDLGFDPAPRSDCAPLTEVADALRAAAFPVRAMRDATRGGLAAVLHEWSERSGLTLAIDERSVPILPGIRGACELLGLDPLYVANEGMMVVAVERGAGERAVAALRASGLAPSAALIGQVALRGAAAVTVVRSMGIDQPLDEPQGSPLPRIC